MRKLRADAKQFDVYEAHRKYMLPKGTLHSVADEIGIDHTNLMWRFRRFGLPLKTKSQAMKGKNIGPKGEAAWNWNGGVTTDPMGYIVHNRDKKRMHRVVIEKHLGRELASDEVVHHIDRNKANNALENLAVMTKREHGQLHRANQAGRLCYWDICHKELV